MYLTQDKHCATLLNARETCVTRQIRAPETTTRSLEGVDEDEEERQQKQPPAPANAIMM